MQNHSLGNTQDIKAPNIFALQMRFFSLTQFIDYCITLQEDVQTVQICINAKKTTVNNYNQQQCKPVLIRLSKDVSYTYTEFVDKFLAGEDITLSFKLPGKWPHKWMVILCDTEPKTSSSPKFKGHYYNKSFIKLPEASLEKAEAAFKEIKTLDEIRPEDIAESF
jgi:hypothetical protein